jgi:hypothetical protein
MAEPNTGGVLRTNIADMKVGDYIKFFANVANAEIFISDGAASSFSELPLTGSPYAVSSSVYRGCFYGIKVDKGLIIADRVIAHSVSWDTLNSKELIQGRYGHVQGDIGGLLKSSIVTRSLGGGNSYATADGKSSTTDTSNGAWPVDNEWDTYIVRKDYGTGAGRDDVWHWSGVFTFTQDTAMMGVDNATTSDKRIIRGNTSRNRGGWATSNVSTTISGFRPCFSYEEQ